jgi:hypothetical protein
LPNRKREREREERRRERERAREREREREEAAGSWLVPLSSLIVVAAQKERRAHGKWTSSIDRPWPVSSFDYRIYALNILYDDAS